MAETVFPEDRPIAAAVSEPQPIEVSPDVADALIALGGAMLFAAAGVLLGFYLMLPVDIG